MFRPIASLLIIVFFNTTSFSQNLNGEIEFEIKYELTKELEPQRSSLPTKMITYMSNGYSRKEELTRIGTQVLINDNNNNKSYLLMEIAEEKLAIQVQDIADSVNIKEKITYINQSKNIAGYLCKKAIINTYDSNIEDANTIEVFYSDEISGVFDLKFKNLKGTPLEYTIKSDGMIITYSATYISTNKQGDYMFEIPKDFNILTMSEFKRLMSN